MAEPEKVIYSIERCISHVPDACRDCMNWEHPYPTCQDILLNEAMELLKVQKTGRWIYENDDPLMIPCSICGYKVFRHNNTPYCPHCGAKMDLEE